MERGVTGRRLSPVLGGRTVHARNHFRNRRFTERGHVPGVGGLPPHPKEKLVGIDEFDGDGIVFGLDIVDGNAADGADGESGFGGAVGANLCL